MNKTAKLFLQNRKTRSIVLTHQKVNPLENLDKIGSGGGTRTPDTRIMMQIIRVCYQCLICKTIKLSSRLRVSIEPFCKTKRRAA